MTALSFVDAANTADVKWLSVQFNEDLVHQSVVRYFAGGRQGSVATKNRSAVRGGGRKPWRQKGTGRARAGTRSSPLWRGGGHTFSLEPKDWSQRFPKKMYRGALRCVFSQLVRESRLAVVDSLPETAGKTKNAQAWLAKTGIENGRTLVVVSAADEAFGRSVSNIPGIAVVNVRGVNSPALLSAHRTIMTKDAEKALTEWLS